MQSLVIMAIALITATSLPVTSAWAGSGSTPALFESNETIDVRIVAPLDVIVGERSVEEEVSGKFFYRGGDGEWIELDVGIRARGNFRRRPDVCSFPPIRLNFKKSQVEDTLFAGQDKLKLATNCKMRSYVYEQAILAEYIAYRILNVISDISFRVRLLRINYEDTGREESFVGYGVLIEHKDQLGQRIGASPLSAESASIAELDLEHLNLVSVFHYLIGNTDFAATSGSPGEKCCHNHELFAVDGGKVYSVPFDFDMSGLVNAPYAIPDSKLRLESVQERYYRGLCVNNDRLPMTLEIFDQRRDDIESMILEQAEIAPRKQRDMLRYIDGFYRSVSSSQGIDRNLIRRCR